MHLLVKMSPMACFFTVGKLLSSLLNSDQVYCTKSALSNLRVTMVCIQMNVSAVIRNTFVLFSLLNHSWIFG